MARTKKSQNTTLQERFWMKVNKLGTIHPALGRCWDWIASIDKDGYGRIIVSGLSRRAHRLSWGFRFGEPSENDLVLHKCDNTKCVNPSHLFVGTQTVNHKDMVSKGRHNCCRGVKQPKAKLTDELVRVVRNRHEVGGRGNSYRALAKEFKVSYPLMRSVILKLVWRHVI